MRPALFVLSLLLVASCGDDDDPGASPSAAGNSGTGGAPTGGSANQGGADAGADNADAGAGGVPPTSTPTPLLFLQRAPRTPGSVFQPGSYARARIVRLSDASADAAETVVCCDDPLFDELDISSFDLAFDASEIVFAGRVAEDRRWALYVASVSSGGVVQLSNDDEHDYFDPIFVGGDRILFLTNRSDDGEPQYRDEVDRGVVLRLGTIARDGTGERLGPGHLAQRRRPLLTADGRVLFEQWDALGPSSAGHLMFVSPDAAGGLSGVREAFGKEQSGSASAYWNAREVAPGRVVAIAGPVNGTFQAGALVDIRLGLSDGDGGYSLEMSEANASERVLSDDVPLDASPSTPSAGRYADAVPLDASAEPELVVSWAAEPGATLPNFGLYRFASASGERTLIYDEPNSWELQPRLIRERPEPAELEAPAPNAFSPDAVLIGGMDVYTSSLSTFEPGTIAAVRVIEGYSSEEGIPSDFGSTAFEGAARLGEADVYDDGSWAALVPANVPLRLQAIDEFGMALSSTPLWISGAPGESLFCGGCHESRSEPTTISPGITDAITLGPRSMLEAVPKADRLSQTFTAAAAVGVPWDLAIQPIFNARCVTCHDGSPNVGNPTWTATDPVSGASVTWSFNLAGGPATFVLGDTDYSGGFSISYFSLLPPIAQMEADGLVISGQVPSFITPGSARTSLLIQKLNPPSSINPAARAFAVPQPHAVEVGQELDADQYRLLVLMADSGGQFYSRENKP